MGKLQWNPLKVVLIDSVFTAVALAIVLLVSNVAVIYVAIALLAASSQPAGAPPDRTWHPPGDVPVDRRGETPVSDYTWMGLASCFLPTSCLP